MAKIELGKMQVLQVLRSTDFGVYLGFSGEEESVLLPKKQVPEKTQIGDKITVFVYKDSEDRLISTTRKPYVLLNEFGWLRVKGGSRIGAFLDWGLEKDLFLPFKEQEMTVTTGDRVCVYVYIDKSGRLAATMKLYDHLEKTAGDWKKEDAFTGFVYRVQRDFGVFAAVCPKASAEEDEQSFRHLYYGLIPASYVFRSYQIGEKISGRVLRVRDDGKLDLSDRKRDFEQLDQDGENILQKIREYGGRLPFADSASPEIIKRELHMSKNAFKKALGHLYKAGKVRILENSVEEVTQEE